MKLSPKFQTQSEFNGPTICERNSKLLSDPTVASTDYRKIDLRNSALQSKNLASNNNENNIFINKNVTFLDELHENWRDAGLYGIIDSLLMHKFCPDVMRTLTGKLKGLLDKMYGNDNSNLEQENTCFRKPLLACHHNIPRIAYSLNGNEINILKLNQPNGGNQEAVLKDKRIKKITCLEWRPNSSINIAAGSENGIVVWFLDGSIPSRRTGYSCTRLFLCGERSNNYVTSISWNTDGTLLASSYYNSDTCLVWNVIQGNYAVLQRVGSPLSYLHWSPCGYHVLSATNNSFFRVWETKNWTCEKWADLNGRCETACWSSCGNILLFAAEKEPYIYCIKFSKITNDDNIDLGNPNVAHKCADLREFLEDENSSSCQVECSISKMIWDKSNSRLALMFGGKNQRSSCIALFHTRITPSLQLTPCGLIHGENNEVPLYIDFLCGFDKGAQLVVYWTNETLSIIPLYFNRSLPKSTSTVSSHQEPQRNMERPQNPVYNGTLLFSTNDK